MACWQRARPRPCPCPRPRSGTGCMRTRGLRRPGRCDASRWRGGFVRCLDRRVRSVRAHRLSGRCRLLPRRCRRDGVHRAARHERRRDGVCGHAHVYTRRRVRPARPVRLELVTRSFRASCALATRSAPASDVPLIHEQARRVAQIRDERIEHLLLLRRVRSVTPGGTLPRWIGSRTSSSMSSAASTRGTSPSAPAVTSARSAMRGS